MDKKGLAIIGMGFGSSLLALNQSANWGIAVRGASDPEDGGACMFEVRGIADKWKPVEELKGLAEKFHVAHYSNDYQDIVSKSDIDVVAVYVPDALHFEVAMAALDAGKHVICTKPMTASLDHAAQIVRRVRETGLKMIVGQTMRFEPQYATLKKMTDAGDFGRLFCARAHYIHDMRPVYLETPWRKTMPQDLLYGGLCHPVDVLRWFMGDVDEVHAYGNRAGLTPDRAVKYDNFVVNLKFKQGGMGSISALYDVVEPPLPMMEVDLMGDRGSAVAEFTDFKPGEVRIKLDRVPTANPMHIDFPAQTFGDRGLGVTVMKYVRHFQDVLLGKAEPSPSALDGAKSVAVCDAVLRSVESGSSVKVQNEF